MELEFKVIAIHGEGDQKTVNALQSHRNKIDHLDKSPNELPDVLVVLRDDYHHMRMEIPLQTWKEVDQWKKIAGYDNDKRHWKHGAKVKVVINSD